MKEKRLPYCQWNLRGVCYTICKTPKTPHCINQVVSSYDRNSWQMCSLKRCWETASFVWVCCRGIITLTAEPADYIWRNQIIYGHKQIETATVHNLLKAFHCQEIPQALYDTVVEFYLRNLTPSNDSVRWMFLLRPVYTAWLRLRFLFLKLMGRTGLNGSVHSVLPDSPLQAKTSPVANRTVWKGL